MSDTKKNRTSVVIHGQQYTIVGSESTNQIRLVASLVDNKMREIRSLNPSLDINKLAVLTAVNAVNDYLKEKERAERLEAEIQRLKE
ncbi:cell division protein ZapA [Bacillus sp. B15-48]|uniref:cell division protein ZapA n=1 Tax=Bacillus sp. B15-48 TaxID=1548601 RepID=UPI0019401C6B|nr:cell division protein ZapA [Bacillus sp. B15-48]MBM4762501.1 cell division protein ZapA [Bacillus sp. B15-48]